MLFGDNQQVYQYHTLAHGTFTLAHTTFTHGKDGGSPRFCIAFQPLNKVAVHDLYRLLRVYDLLDQSGKPHYFTSLASGYWQIPIDPKDALWII